MLKPFSKFFWFTVALALIFTSSLEVPVWSGETLPYSQERFEKAKSDGKTILLDFHASWCPTCQRQKVSLEKVLKEKEFSKVVAFEVNYDKETKLEKELRVSSQSTLILFNGNKEISRSISQTETDDLRNFLAKAAQK